MHPVNLYKWHLRQAIGHLDQIVVNANKLKQHLDNIEMSRQQGVEEQLVISQSPSHFAQSSVTSAKPPLQ